jgi:hypothetical protein
MHIISRIAFRQFCEQYPDSESALTRWFKLRMGLILKLLMNCALFFLVLIW